VNLEAFRRQHPTGENVVLAEDVKRAFARTYGSLSVSFEPLEEFINSLS
jgi:hypothetical protein